jgi:hypothetical protein
VVSGLDSNAEGSELREHVPNFSDAMLSKNFMNFADPLKRNNFSMFKEKYSRLNSYKTNQVENFYSN